MLIKVQAKPGGPRSEVRELVDIFRGRIVDVGPEEVMIELSGRENKIQAFIERMRLRYSRNGKDQSNFTVRGGSDRTNQKPDPLS